MTAVPAADRSASRSALLYDTAASLRLVDTELDALGAEPPGDGHVGLSDPAPYALARATAGLRAVLATLRDGRAALQHTARAPHAPTPVADALDALDRTQALVDDLEAAEVDDDRTRATALRAGMRAELFGLVGALHEPSVAARQLAYAVGVLQETEARLLRVARLLDAADRTAPVDEVALLR